MIKEFLLHVGSAFIFCDMLSFIHSFAVDQLHLGFLLSVCYIESFVKSRFVISRLCSRHFTITFAGLQNTVRLTEDFVIFEVPLYLFLNRIL